MATLGYIAALLTAWRAMHWAYTRDEKRMYLARIAKRRSDRGIRR